MKHLHLVLDGLQADRHLGKHADVHSGLEPLPCCVQSSSACNGGKNAQSTVCDNWCKFLKMSVKKMKKSKKVLDIYSEFAILYNEINP